MKTRFLSLFTFCIAIAISLPAGAVSSVNLSQDATVAPAVANGFGGSRVASMATAPQTTTAPQLTRAERKSMRKTVRKSVREQLGSAAGVGKIALIIIAIILPPLAMFLYDGLSNRFWISLLLTLLFYFPGLIYTIFIIAKDK